MPSGLFFLGTITYSITRNNVVKKFSPDPYNSRPLPSYQQSGSEDQLEEEKGLAHPGRGHRCVLDCAAAVCLQMIYVQHACTVITVQTYKIHFTKDTCNLTTENFFLMCTSAHAISINHT